MSDTISRKGNFSLLSLLSGDSAPTVLFASMLIITVLFMIIPIPSWMLDFLMSVSLLFAIIITLTVTYITNPVEFSIFPTLLLFTTIFRLAINVSSTRLILNQGVDFSGKMVRAFGSFVVGSQGDTVAGMIIGIIIFLMLVLVQFIVITRGTTRVSEVAARFSLDSMNQKFMAIEMDMNNGVITEEEAIKRRQNVQIESQFYGNMDGASKFVQGDVIMGILLTLTNIIGGLLVGIFARGEDASIAMQNYVPLTIGDGLVSQIPSLLIGVATGLIVTRSQAKDAIGKQISDQLIRDYRIFAIAGSVLLLLAFLPGFPHIILAVMAFLMFGAAYMLNKNTKKQTGKSKANAQDEAQGESTVGSDPNKVSEAIKTDPLALQIGYELIPLAKDGELVSSMGGIRNAIAIDTGMVIPKIRIVDNVGLQPNEYQLLLKGQVVAKNSFKIDHLMAMGQVDNPLQGEKTKDPAFGLDAIWIEDDMREDAERRGYTVVDAAAVISTHIQEVLKSHLSEILDREQVRHIIDNLQPDHPTLVNEINARYQASVAPIQKILQNLLKEGVSIRDTVTIFETLTDCNPNTPTLTIVEIIRQALKRSICSRYVDDDNKLYVLKMHPLIEREISSNCEFDPEGNPLLRMKPDTIMKIQALIRDKVTAMINDNKQPVIMTNPDIRRVVWEICQQIHHSISVISTREIPSDMEVILFGMISVEKESKSA